MIELGVYTRYDSLGASSRLRLRRYTDYLSRNGFDAGLHPLFGNDYLRRLYSERNVAAAALRGLASRLLKAPAAEKNLLIEYELLPWMPFGVEKRLIGRRRYVLDFDDAVYLKYAGHPMLADKYDRLAAGAAGIMVANEALKTRFSVLNPNTIKIPTAIDPGKFNACAEKFTAFTAVWIGTPVTCAAYLDPFMPTLRRMREIVDFELLVIGAVPAEAPGRLRVRCVPWSETAEAELLPKCHVGIMPLPDNDAFAAGKSAYKLIQYLAAGIPSIASPVGENRVVVRAGETGFLAATRDEWLQALAALHRNDGPRLKMGEASRRESEKYAVSRYAPIIADFLKKSFRGA